MLNGNEILLDVQNRMNIFRKIFSSSNPQIAFSIIKGSCREGTPNESLEMKRKILEGLFHYASPIYWETNILRSVEEGSDLFKGKTFPAFNPNPQIWIPSWKGTRPDGTYGAITMSIDASKNGFGMCGIIAFWMAIMDDSNCGYCGEILCPHFFDEVGYKEYSKDPLHPPFIISEQLYLPQQPIEDEFGSVLLAGFEFLNQPFVDNCSLDRVATFDGAHRQAKKNDAKKIRIVYLRRREQHPTLQDGSSNPVDWSCQWLVHGHWRNQYHPSDQSRKPMFIQSYVKGPEDKPFKASQKSIFAAVR